MALEFTTVPVDFTKGLDTRSNPKLVLPGDWNLLENCTLAVDGALTKRDGHVAMVASAQVEATKGHGLVEFDDELLVINGPKVSRITSPDNPSVATQAVQLSGLLPFLHLTRESVARSSDLADSPDCAVGGGEIMYVWRTYSAAGAVTGISYAGYDADTGGLLASGQASSSVNASTPRVVWDGSAFVIFWLQSGNLIGYVRTAGPAPTGSSTILVAAAGNVIDACAFGGADVSAVSYLSTDATYSVFCAKITRAAGFPVLSATTGLMTQAQIPNTAIVGIATGKLGSYCGTYTYAPTTGLGYSHEGLAGANINTAWAASLATLLRFPSANVVSFCHVAATDWADGLPQACVCFDQISDYGGGGAGAGTRDVWRTYVEAGAPGAAMTLMPGAGTVIRSAVYVGGGGAGPTSPQGPFICGKPVVVMPPTSAGAGYLAWPGTVALPCRMIAGSGNAQSGVFFLDAVSGQVVGKAMYGRLGRLLGAETSTPSTPWVAPAGAVSPQRPYASTFVLPVLESGRLSFEDGIDTTAVGVAALHVTPNAPHGSDPMGAFAPRSVQLGRTTHVANGMLSMYDGTRMCESNWNMYPEGISVTRAGGGGTWPAGQYQFVAVYEWVDAQGQRHQSAPSQPFTLAVTLNDTLTFQVPTLFLTWRYGVRHALYGTLANGTIFYRITATIANPTLTAWSSTVVLNPPVASNELLYTQPEQAGTTLANVASGPCSTVGIHQNRLWCDLTDQDGAIRYSQEYVDGVGLQWNEALELSLPVGSGVVARTASMDDTLVVLASERVYRVTGSGPSPSGANNGYSTAVEVPSDVGASNPRAVVEMPVGVVFFSRKGWYLLSRDLAVRYIGAPVKGFDGDTFTSAVLMPDRQELRIGSSRTRYDGYWDPTAPTALGGPRLTYSYVSDAWSMASVQSRTGAGQRWLATYDARYWRAAGRYVAVSLQDGLNGDTAGVYSDQVGTSVAPLAVGMRARTAFFRLAGLEGYQRVRWLYLTMSASVTPVSNLILTVDYDDDYQAVTPPGAPGSYATTPALLSSMGFASPAAIDVRHKFRRQKCKSLAVTIEELPTLAGPAGVTGMQAMALVVGLKDGANRLPAAQGVG
jgi:hypothetical protein